MNKNCLSGRLNIDFTEELAELLIATSDIAISIRLNSSYYISKPTQAASENVHYLSDSLHNLKNLASSIQSKDLDQILWACDFHLARFKSYYPSRPGFEDHHAKRALQQLISTLTKIKNKTLQAKV